MKRITLGAWMLLASLSGPVQAAIIYDNTTTDMGSGLSYILNSYTGVGDQIHLAGTERTATGATVQFYNSGTVSGTFDATLRLFQVGSPTQIGSDVTMTSIFAPSGGASGFNVSFSLPGIVVPDDLRFLVLISSVANGLNLEMSYYGPVPGTGTSDPTFAVGFNGALVSAPTPDANLFFQLEAITVPEPSTLAMAGAAMAALLLRARRR